MVNACAGRDDVNDRVDGTDLVEMDLVERYVVNTGFGFSKEFEGVKREMLDGFGEVCRANESADVGERAAVDFLTVVRVRVRSVGDVVGLEDVGIGGGDTGAVYGFGAQARVEAERGGGLLQHS
jgi:hypothetical protein